MSLRNDPQAQKKVSRAARRTAALKRAVAPVVGDSRPFEVLETRVMMSLVHHYPFNEGDGTRTNDAVGTRHGTLITDVDPTAGDQGTEGLAAGPGAVGVSWRTDSPSPAGGSYLHFDGDRTLSGTPPVLNTFNNVGGRVDVSAANSLDQSFHNEMGFHTSVSFYIRFTDLDSTEYVGNDTMWQAPAVTGNEQGSFGNDSFHGTILANGRIGMQKSDGARAQSTTSLKDGSWHQVVVSRDYDTGQARVYVDGRLQNTTNTNAGPVNSFWDAVGALTLVGTDGTTLQGYNYMNNVDLDDVRMYNHVLTQGEVTALVPAALSGPLAVAPVITGVTADPNNGSNATLTFTDANPNEAGFIVERAALLPNGQPGPFVAIGQIGNGTNLTYFDTTISQYNQQMVYRVRPFNTSGEGQNTVSAPFTSSATYANPAGLGNGLAAGFIVNQFWGANGRQWPTDPNPNDGVTDRAPNNQAENVGSIDLEADDMESDRLADGVTVKHNLHDPANPNGITARDPEGRVIDNFTQTTAPDPFTGQTVGRLRRDYVANAPAAGIRADSFSSVHSGRLTIPRDFNSNGTEADANVLVKFVAWGDDDIHVYVNGQLVSTDPNGHGAREGGALNVDIGGGVLRDGTNNGVIALTEGESYDIVVLHSDGTGNSAMGVKWGLVTRNEDGSYTHPALASMAFIPVTYLTPVANRPQASSMTLRGTPSEHMVSFNILDTTTSEQRFELWRKLSTEPDAAYVKVNEAGINSPFISDASALPGTTYDYILIGVNATSGSTDLAAAIANKQTVTTAAAVAPVQGLKAFYYNDDFWGQGETRPLPANGNLFVGPAAWSLTGADVYERGINPQFNYGDDNHLPAVRPGGSPHVDIRDNAHSTVWVGKLIIKPGEEGQYYILGFGDDDTHVIVNNVITSSDPNGHGPRNPFPTGATNYQPTNNGGFVNPINLTAGEHDIVILQSEQGGGSGIFLRWHKPGTANPTTTAPTDVPADQLSTGTGLPLAPGKPVVTDPRGTSVAVTAADNATNELRNELVVATDAGFTQNVRRIPIGIRVATGAATNPTSLRITGLTPGVQYFIKAVSMNTDGQAESEVETFNTGAIIAPAAPSALVVRPQTVNTNLLSFTDNSTDETGFLIQRRRKDSGEAFATIAETGPGVNTYRDELDGSYTPGTVLEYQVIATNNGVQSAASPIVAATPLGGPGGTGLQMRVWATTTADAAGAQGNVFNPDHVNTYSTTNVGYGRVAEPARNADGSAQAPVVDTVDGLIPDNWGAGIPHFGTREVETFNVEWVGWIVAEQSKAYDFSIVTDDGGRLWLDDVEVIDGHWRDGAGEAFSEPVTLTAGQKVKVRFQMYEQGGGASARLRWNGPNNNAREDVPAVFMFPDNGTGAGSNPFNAADRVSQRPVSYTEVFALPPIAANAPGYIAVRWQENAFGEAGYDVQRAENAEFTNPVLVSFDDVNYPAAPDRVGPGRSLFVDDGGFNLGQGNLDPNKTYYYRVKPRFAPDSEYVFAGSAKPLGVAVDNNGNPYTANIDTAGTDLALANFASPEMVTLNGWSSVTAEKTLKLTHNQNDRVGSAFLNRAFDVDTDFKVNFDFRIGETATADGMTFVIHNYTPTLPDSAPSNQTRSSQLRAMGPGGGFFGYGTNTDPANRQPGIQNSVAVVFDFHDALDTLGVYTNGKVPPGGVIANYSPAAGPNYIRTTPANAQSPNGSFDLRNTANLTTGTTAIDINGGTIFRLQVNYEERGTEVDGIPGPSEFDTGLLTINLINAADVNQKVLFTAKYNVDLATEVGQDTAVMGWTAGTGGANARMEVYNFKYDGPVDAVNPAVVSEVFVRGADWLGQDNNPSTSNFMEYLEAKGLGDDNYGYRLFGPGRTPAAGNDHDILPWINMDQLVVKYNVAPTGAGVPTPGSLSVAGVKGNYTVTSVTPVAGDPTAFVLTLNKPLGGGNPATGLAPTPEENGDIITLGVPGGGAAGSNFTLKMNVLQGDTDHLNEGNNHVVLARDFAEVKKKFFKNTLDVPAGNDTDYNPFFDVDGSGNILARDYAEVKKRFFQSLTIPAAAGAEVFSATRVAEEVLA